MWTVDWESGFVVGGDGGRRLTPSFRLREFQRPDGTVRVHRELVAGLQLLRNRFGKSLAIRLTDADGLGAVVAGDPAAELLEAAGKIRELRVFESVEAQQDGVHVRIPDPDNLPGIELEQALETAFSVTAAFETAGDKFQQVTGNFDGAGISFGPAQVNFKSGTLVPLFRLFMAADEVALRGCFADKDDYEEWLRVMDLPSSSRSNGPTGLARATGGDTVEPWQDYFQAVGRVEPFRAITVETILRDYGARMLRAVKALHKLKPDIQIDHLRSSALYDTWSYSEERLDKAWPASPGTCNARESAGPVRADPDRSGGAWAEGGSRVAGRFCQSSRGYLEGSSRDGRRSTTGQYQFLHAARCADCGRPGVDERRCEREARASGRGPRRGKEPPRLRPPAGRRRPAGPREPGNPGLAERRQLHAEDHSQIVDVVREVVIDRELQVAADGIEAVVARPRAIHVENRPAFVVPIAQNLKTAGKSTPPPPML